MNCIETTSGLYFDYRDPKPEQVNIEDVARALSQIPRFGGHTNRHYSVAQHAVLVAQLVGPKNARVQFAALHHDSHEAYLGDVPSPLKALLGDTYRNLRVWADMAIAEKLRIDEYEFHHDAIVEADRTALRIEAAYLKHSHGIGEHWGYDGLPVEVLRHNFIFWSPANAEDAFLTDHDKLCRGLHGRVIR